MYAAPLEIMVSAFPRRCISLFMDEEVWVALTNAVRAARGIIMYLPQRAHFLSQGPCDIDAVGYFYADYALSHDLG